MDALIAGVISVLSPMLTAIAAKLKVHRKWLPFICSGIAAILAGIAEFTGMVQNLPWYFGFILGLIGSGLRQMYHELTRKEDGK